MWFIAGFAVGILVVIGMFEVYSRIRRTDQKGRFYAREKYVEKAVIVKRYEGTEFECMNCSSVKTVTVDNTHWKLTHSPCHLCRREAANAQYLET